MTNKGAGLNGPPPFCNPPDHDIAFSWYSISMAMLAHKPPRLHINPLALHIKSGGFRPLCAKPGLGDESPNRAHVPRKLKCLDTCPFPTPASPRYHISMVFMSSGSGPPGNFRDNRAPRANGTVWDKMGQKNFRTPNRRAGSPAFQGATKRRHRLDIGGKSPDNLRQKPSAPTLKCRLLSYIFSFFAFPARPQISPALN